MPSAPIIYGAKKQYATQPSAAPLFDKKGNKFIQQVCGKVLFLGRVIDSTLLCQISDIASQSATLTKKNETNIPTVGLHRYTRGRSNNTHQQQQEIGSPQ